MNTTPWRGFLPDPDQTARLYLTAPVVPGPIHYNFEDPAAGAGRKYEGTDWGFQPVNPGDFPPEDPQRDRRRLDVVVLCLGLMLLALAGATFLVQRANVLPAGVPIVGMDSGVAACRAIAEGEKPVPSGAAMTQQDYRALRAVFADSRYPDIRDNGTKIVDIAWQVAALDKQGDTEMISALAYANSLTSAYAGLTGGCAEHGYTLAPLN